MRYSIEPRERRYVKGYGFLSIAKSICKNLSNKYGQKLVDSAKISATDALKIASNRAIQKTAEASGNLVGNFIADKQKVNHTQMQLAMKYQKKDIYFHKRDKRLLMN